MSIEHAVNSLGPLMNTLYTQLPDLSGSGAASSRSNRRRASTPQSRRRSSRNNQRAFSFDPTADLPDDLGAGFGAFADLFGRSNSNDEATNNGGVDFASLLRTVVTEGQRQGIDALSALRAAGRVQDELRRFQLDPTAWFEGVGERFRTPTPEVGGEAGGYNTRSRTRSRQNQQQQQQQRASRRGGAGGGGGGRFWDEAEQPNSWWSNVASGVNDFLKREPDSNAGGSRSRRNRPPASYNDY